MKIKANMQLLSPSGFEVEISLVSSSVRQITATIKELKEAGYKSFEKEKSQAGQGNNVLKPRFDDQLPTPEFDSQRQIDPASRRETVHITKITVGTIQAGQNVGLPKWEIETDANINFCIFNLDVLVNGQYITRKTALDTDTWQKTGWQHIPEEPLAADIYKKDNGYWDVRFVHPSEDHIKTVYPPKVFDPQNIREINDIVLMETEQGKRSPSWQGKTEDMGDVKIVNYIRDHMQGVGHDTSTWEQENPHIRQNIIVSLNEEELSRIFLKIN